MKRQMPCRYMTLGRQRGMILLMVTTLLLATTALGILVLDSALSGFYRSVGLERRMQATWQAEAALSLAQLRLKALEAPSTLPLPYTLIPDTVQGDGTYSAILVNNPADPDRSHDNDGIFVIRATGMAHGGAARRTIESFVQLELRPMVWPGVLVMGGGTQGSLRGNSSVNGYDAAPGGAAVAGVAFENSDQSLSGNATGNVRGVPDYSWGDEAFAEGNDFSGRAQELIDILSERPSSVRLSSWDKDDLGTPAAPQVTVIDVGEQLTLSGQISGAGVLIVRGHLHLSGQLNFEGVILVDGDSGSLQLSGKVDVKGGLALTPPRGGGGGGRLDIVSSGNLKLQYLSTACKYAADLVPEVVVRSYRLTT